MNENEQKMLDNFRTDMHMDNAEWYMFCKRYAFRRISTIIWYLEQKSGRLPKESAEKVQAILQAQLS